jgi:asparagine synthase (glutamine-hydrolysing)
MCGITGIVGPKPTPDKQKRIERMTRRLAHRGPDAKGFFVENEVAFGHRRLSIIDLSNGANQPMQDVGGRYVLIFNGEIYNYKEVKELLPDYPFRTKSDSEVILAAYACWGAECLQHFNGMFAFAIWDRKTRELFVARDRLGVKPFYYYQQDETLVFSSELRSLLASGLLPARLDLNSVCNYLMYQSVCAPLTILEGVFRLMPGEYGIFKNGQFERHFYWQIENRSEKVEISDAAEVKKHVRRLLTESVERRTVSDVPLGAFLSGGIDSSAVVGLMAECSVQPVHTFSINFEEPEFDESRYSNLIAKRFNTHHTPLLLRANDFLESLPEALAAMDSPSGDGFNAYLVSKITKQAGITVALSGIGGDELFAGYTYFHYWLRIRRQWWWQLPAGLRTMVGRTLHHFSRTARMMRLSDIAAAQSPDIEHIYPSMRQVLAPQQAKRLINNIERVADPLQNTLHARREALHQLPLLSQYSVAELLGYTLNVLLKDTDQMSMASALEVREPFFDYKLVEYVLQIPDALKYPRYPKSLLVESLSPLLPDEIVRRPKKGFSLPWKYWMRNELRSWCEEKLEHLCQRSSFNADEIQQLSRRFFQTSNGNTWVQIFQMAVLEDWLERNDIAA